MTRCRAPGAAASRALQRHPLLLGFRGRWTQQVLYVAQRVLVLADQLEQSVRALETELRRLPAGRPQQVAEET
mgnify:CR=1 FL=1